MPSGPGALCIFMLARWRSTSEGSITKFIHLWAHGLKKTKKWRRAPCRHSLWDMAHFIVSRGCMHVVPDVPEGVDGCLGVPEFDDVRLMKTEQCLHRLLRHVRHRLLVDQRHEAVDQLQCTALDLVPSLARVLLHAHVHTPV